MYTGSMATNRILYVHKGATGYDTGYWKDPLQNADKCGFTLKYIEDEFEPTAEQLLN